MKKIICFIFLIFNFIILSSCNNSNNIATESELIIYKNAITMYVGDTEPIYYEGNATFLSADESVATVNEKGEVTGIAPGNTTIIANPLNNPKRVQIIVIDKVITEEKYRNGNMKLQFKSPILGYDDKIDAPIKLSYNVFDDDVLSFTDFKFDFNVDLSKNNKANNTKALKDIFGLQDNGILSLLNLDFPLEYKLCCNGLNNYELNDLHIDVNNLNGISFMIYDGDKLLLTLGNNGKENSSSMISTIMRLLSDMNYDYKLIQEMCYNTMINRFFPNDSAVIDDAKSESIRKTMEPILKAVDILTGGINIDKKQINSNTYKIIITLNEYGKKSLIDLLSSLIPESYKDMLSQVLGINDFSFQITAYQDLKNSHNHIKELRLLIDLGAASITALKLDLNIELEDRFNNGNTFNEQKIRNNDLSNKYQEFYNYIYHIMPLLSISSNDSIYNISLLKNDQDLIKYLITNLDNLDSKLLLNDTYDNLMDKYNNIYNTYLEAVDNLSNAANIEDIYNALSGVIKYKDLFNAIKTDYPDIYYNKLVNLEIKELNDLSDEIKNKLNIEASYINSNVDEDTESQYLNALDVNIKTQDKINKILNYKDIILDNNKLETVIKTYNNLSDYNIKLFNKLLAYYLNTSYDNLSNIKDYISKLGYGYDGEKISDSFYNDEIKDSSLVDSYKTLAKNTYDEVYNELLDHYNKYKALEEEKLTDLSKYSDFISINDIYCSSYFKETVFDASELDILIMKYEYNL